MNIQYAKRFLLFVCLVALVASCGPVTSMPLATNVLPTYTAVPPTFNLPEATATATLSQVDEIFSLPTRPAGLVDTPTPVATPESDSSTAELKEMSESEFLNLIGWLNDYSYQNFPPFMDWWSEGNFISSQRAVALVIQEYLYRFPENPNTNRLRWQLAFINSIEYSDLPGNQYGDEWMIAELERRLNQSETTPDQLEDILGQYWFDVAYVHRVEDLFQDGKVGWLYQVVPQIWNDERVLHNESVSQGSLFFVVRDIGENKYELYLLESAWNLSFGDSYVFDTSDHNSNGVPEIALYIGGHGGTICSGKLHIFEWSGYSFEDLANGKLNLNDCSESFEYSEVNNAPVIIYSAIMPSRKEQYAWTGQSYEFEKYLDAAPLEIWLNSALGSHSASYSDEENLLKTILASEEASSLGSSYHDYLRYRLGVVLALQSKSREAGAALKNLISAPKDTTRDIFPGMAKTFLELYKDNASLYSACVQSNQLFDRALDPYGNSSGSVEDEVYEEVVGFPFDPFSVYVARCNENSAFEQMVGSIPTTIVDLPTALRNHGVNLYFSRHVDVNLDGQIDEWIVALDAYSLFLVFPQGSHYQAKELNASLEFDSLDVSAVAVYVEAWDGFTNPILVIHSDPEFSILEVDKNYEAKSLFYDFAVEDFIISHHDAMPQLQIYFLKPSNYGGIDRPWGGYRWDAQQSEFKDDLLEYDLFVRRDPISAVEIVDKLLPVLDEWKQNSDSTSWSPLPYIYYIVGLAYELSGNQQKAAEIYWQIWHDFPNSDYALLARSKLEPVNP